MPKGIRNFVIFAIAIIVSWIVGSNVPATWTVEQITLDVLTDDSGQLYYIYRGKPAYFDAVPIEQAQLNPARIHGSNETAAHQRRICLIRRRWRNKIPTTPRKTPLGLLVTVTRGGGRALVLDYQRTRHGSFGRYYFGRAYFNAL